MRSRNLLIVILFIKVASCAFAYYVFSLFAQLGDSEQYINATLDLGVARLIDRTYLVENFFAFLAIFLGKGFLIHLATAILVGLTIWYVFKSYAAVLPKMFWVTLLLPLFAVWTSIVGKEALSFCVFLIISKWVADAIIYNKANTFQMLFAVAIGTILRPHYLLAYLVVILVVYLLLYKREIRLFAGKTLSKGVYVSFIVVLAMAFITIAMQYDSYWKPFLDYLMSTSEAYFLSYDGNTNRSNIPWNTLDDFIANIYWGIPTSIIGPTIWESLQKPIMIPFFMEGLFSFLLIFYFSLKLASIAKNNKRVRLFLYVSFLPAICIALLAHYPFGIFNPGTATRYKQSLTPLFYFLPLLIICANNLKKRQVYP